MSYNGIQDKSMIIIIIVLVLCVCICSSIGILLYTLNPITTAPVVANTNPIPVPVAPVVANTNPTPVLVAPVANTNPAPVANTNPAPVGFDKNQFYLKRTDGNCFDGYPGTIFNMACNNGNNQNFTFNTSTNAANSYSLTQKATKQCLDGGSNDNIYLMGCTPNNLYQTWIPSTSTDDKTKNVLQQAATKKCLGYNGKLDDCTSKNAYIFVNAS